MGILRSLDGRFFDVPEDVLERCVIPEKIVRRLRGVEAGLETEEALGDEPETALETEDVEAELCPVGAEEGGEDITAQSRRRRRKRRNSWHNWSNWYNWNNWYNWHNG